ncbi:hypothetical protein SARC_15905 [Sphaeroforma arctica JP610]|uniref:Uncharacterized protein n=1 Tax=Sphaeroforma arctica JP610 TaxID=667725 RepID=A0A0L0F4F6_9EUKA|nr:hypothetical protein SARC_15905 [Sphaeroforma arctica JP610]KNC71557.1 hypothetical protein SARC_15905 [Sphaeroforma arctica JP610]|eukprot:XP_014145459.1 hypothetical protein SARC_15905 [Sphaeroforma arctica JP610]
MDKGGRFVSKQENTDKEYVAESSMESESDFGECEQPAHKPLNRFRNSTNGRFGRACKRAPDSEASGVEEQGASSDSEENLVEL